MVSGIRSSATHMDGAQRGILCPPGQPTLLSGAGSARSGILLSWDGQVIGGGVVRADGHWQLPVQPAADAPSGDYAVMVTQRDSGQVLATWTCHVDNTSLPTPGQRMPDRGTPPRTATVTGTPQPTATAPAAPTPPPPATMIAIDGPPAEDAPPGDDGSPVDDTPLAMGCITICIVAADVTTDDAPGYLVLQNDASAPADLMGWTLRTTNEQVLPLTATLAPGDTLLVYALDGDDAPGMVCWPNAALRAGAEITLTNAAGVVQQHVTLP